MNTRPYIPGDETRIMTIQRYIAQEERMHPGATGEFSTLLRNLALAVKVVSREVRRAGLVDILGKASTSNVSGDEVKKLDVFANDMIINALESGGQLCVMASEENETVIPIPEEFPCGGYAMLFDPLDGSSNIDANVTIGTVFSIFKRVSKGVRGTVEDVVQPGYRQVAAGYIMYGSSTIMVFTTGKGVQGFTLDPTIGAFLLSHPDLTIPKRGNIYSVNEGNRQMWDEGFRRYIDYVQSDDPATGRPYKGRYVGSMIADVHRTILYGGVFAYPGDTKNPEGKLRLLYEANPVAFLVEQAGGRATDGHRRILDIEPTDVHQRTPLLLGSTDDVLIAEEFINGKR
ncbi:MAG: class 1 fructose-bisphosphatase [Ignavibacteria bacterium]|nr:MAG: class 1 fructose-bisphosphatase [Ignavibacteria bacterium]